MATDPVLLPTEPEIEKEMELSSVLKVKPPEISIPNNFVGV